MALSRGVARSFWFVMASTRSVRDVSGALRGTILLHKFVDGQTDESGNSLSPTNGNLLEAARGFA
jgi:hypothetical protein